MFPIGKFTQTLNYRGSFFPNYYAFQDLITNQIIGHDRKFGGLYILDQVPRSLVCFSISTPFEIQYRLGHPSLFILNNLCPQLQSLLNLEC